MQYSTLKIRKKHLIQKKEHLLGMLLLLAASLLFLGVLEDGWALDVDAIFLGEAQDGAGEFWF